MPIPAHFVPDAQTWSGDRNATSRYLSPLALHLDHLGRLLGPVVAAPLLGLDVGVLLWFGVRQGVHSVLLGTRGLAALQRERAQLAGLTPPGAIPSTAARALLRRNRRDRHLLSYYMALDTSTSVGAGLIAAGTLFRAPLLGSVAPGLLPLIYPLSLAGFFPLVIPGVIGVGDRGVRAIAAERKIRPMRRYLERRQVAHGALIASLYADRQHERRNYYLAHGTSFAGLVAGATISVFVGPIGLPLLLVGTLGVVACESIGLRVVKVSDAVPLQERASLTTDRAFTRAIIDTHAELATLQALRHLRRPMYPAGWGTSFRPLLRLQRWVLRRRQRDAPGTRYAVLAAAEARNRLLPAVAAPLPGDRLLTLMERCRSAEAFYASLLKDEPVRRALEGHGVLRRKKRWFVFPDALSTRIDELQATPPLFERIHSHAEEVLLTYGKTQIHRRQRALLDLYGAFAAEVSREVPQVGVGRRAVQRRNSNCWVKGPAVASA